MRTWEGFLLCIIVVELFLIWLELGGMAVRERDFMKKIAEKFKLDD